MRIIFEDNHLLVINKPAGILTQPSGTIQSNLEEQAKKWIKQTKGKEGNVYLHAIHRLDKSVRGIVIFAKTSKALSRLTSSIRNKNVKKFYRALVENSPPSKKGTLENGILHEDYFARIVRLETPGAKVARLHYQVTGQIDNQTALEIELETGRYHQIRAQLSAIGCPIVGDMKYGSHQSLENQEIALEHFRITIPHPISKEPLTFEIEESPFWDYS